MAISRCSRASRTSTTATLLESTTAQEYLGSRGIGNADLIAAYRIGYADGSLLAKAKGALREAIVRLGVITSSGHEAAARLRCLPAARSQRRRRDLYGRAIDRDAHLYLPGTHRGLFNAETLRGAGEVSAKRARNHSVFPDRSTAGSNANTTFIVGTGAGVGGIRKPIH